MTVAARDQTSPKDSSLQPVPSGEKDLTMAYAVWTMGGVAVGAMLLLYLLVFRPFSLERMDDRHLYGLAAPVMAVSAMALMFGVLLMSTRRVWALSGCALTGVLATLAYYGACYSLDQSLPVDAVSLGFVAIGLISLLAFPTVQGHLRKQPLKVIEPPSGVVRVGNLGYTWFGLLLLFSWLLWFDFCFTLMETVLGPIIQFRLANDLNMDSFWYMLCLGTIPNIVNFFLNPIISIKSDRHRGPRGRRIPFLLYGAPVVCACLALVGFGNDIAAWMQESFLKSMSLVSVTIWTFAILSLLFTIFNMFLGTTFYYLFNDVVPPHMFVRFMAYFRAAGTVAGMIYSKWIYAYSNKSGPLNIEFLNYHNDNFWYPKLILVGAAVFYTIAGTLAIIKVKEPNYPPPDPLPEGSDTLDRAVKTIRVITQECFSHRFYVLYFLTMIAVWMSYQMGPFMNPSRVAMGMDLQVLGDIGFYTGPITLALTLLTAGYGDRFRPLPLMVAGTAMALLIAPIQLLFLIPGLSSQTYLYIAIGFSLIGIPIGIIVGLAEGPLTMSLMPQDRYGQFAAAQSMLRMVFAGILGTLLAGKIMAILKDWQGDYAWRYSFVWSFLFQMLNLFCYYLLYREWKRLGGAKGFKPPPVRRMPAQV